MQIQIPLNDRMAMSFRINSIEHINTTDPCAKIGITLAVETDDELHLLTGLTIGSEILKIVESAEQ